MPRATAQLVFTVVGALAIGFGVPLAWVWIGSKIQGTTGSDGGGNHACDAGHKCSPVDRVWPIIGAAAHQRTHSSRWAATNSSSLR